MIFFMLKDPNLWNLLYVKVQVFQWLKSQFKNSLVLPTGHFVTHLLSEIGWPIQASVWVRAKFLKQKVNSSNNHQKMQQ